MNNKLRTSLLFLLIFTSFAFARRKNREPVDTSMQARIKSAKAEDFTMSAGQLRIIMQELTGRYSSIIETSADKIINEATEKQHKTAALQWKLAAIPTLYRSLFYNRPLIGLIDVWACTQQMKNYFGTPEAKELFGPWASEGLDATIRLEAEVKNLAISLPRNGNIDRATQTIEAWAKENPIESFTSHRETMILELTSGIGSTSLNAFQSLGKLTNQLDDIMAQVTVYGSYIPKGIEWQSELILNKVGNAQLTDSLMQEVSLITDDIHAMRRTVTSLPYLISKERKIVFDEVAEERDIALTALAQERELILEAVATERAIVLEAVDSIRATVTQDATTISKDVVNLIFLRLFQFTGLFFVLGFVALLYFKKQKS